MTGDVHGVRGAVSLQAIGSLAFWLALPLLVVTAMSTHGDSRHLGDDYGGSRIVLATASTTESRGIAGRKLAMAAGGASGGGGGGGELPAAGDSADEATAECAAEWSASDSESDSAFADDPRHSKLVLAESTLTSSRSTLTSSRSTSSRKGSGHGGSRQGRLLQSTEAEEWVSAHNQVRSAVGVGGLTWSDTVANSAESWATTLKQSCEMKHAQNSGYGENLYMAWSSRSISIKPSEVVKSWASEKQYYNYASNSCAGGKVCGHYTQVVWQNTKEVGCAIVSCMRGTSNAQIAVCRYNPPGNYRGQKPY
ncbi:hypothetical protein CBR_g49657 [Chara braunii]|uniref:SCP domain-containing protein n=1 Tax=Chara braunii TaxID=69332 RepID=A0A388M5I6_CHABU|nr:hypothetical protein CBR_g49657 [Chara braunii]|eukprot:GBG89806.1 hypothetical protein CBR_g49657 [Chara braunii]